MPMFDLGLLEIVQQMVCVGYAISFFLFLLRVSVTISYGICKMTSVIFYLKGIVM